jgi:cytochrome c peroxidase
MTKSHVTLCSELGAFLIACVSIGVAASALAGDTNPGTPAAKPRASTNEAAAAVPNASPPSTAEAEKTRAEKPVGGPLHGAQPMDEQLAQLARWLPEVPNKNAPAGVDPVYWQSLIPADNQLSAERVALGRKLYFDTRLSKDGTVACATCHDASRGFTDRRGRAEGIRDQIGQRNSPVTLNAAFFSSQFWDGRASSLEEQAKLPIVNPIEMGQADGAAAVKAIAGDAAYQAAFKAAYGRPVNYDDMGRAIASFERTLIFLDAPFDRFARGDSKAISADAAAGWALFNGKGRCVSCHQISSSSPIGTDNRFHNIGVSARHQDFEKLAKAALSALAKDSSKESLDQLALQTNLSELGRFTVTRNRSEIGAFKTSQLRNIGVTGPYMHDGSMSTLWDVIDHYNKGGEANPYLDGGIEPLALSEREVSQLVEFLFTLTDTRLDDQNRAEHTRQQQLAAAQRPFRDEDAASRKLLQFEARVSGKR